MLGHSYNEKKNKFSVAQSSLISGRNILDSLEIMPKNIDTEFACGLFLPPLVRIDMYTFPLKNLSNLYAKIKTKLWSDTKRPKARRLAQHGGQSG
jgi:hypothetical protein